MASDPFTEIDQLIGDLRINQLENDLKSLMGIPNKLAYLKDARSRVEKAIEIDTLIAHGAYEANELLRRIDEHITNQVKLQQHATSVQLIDPQHLRKLFDKLSAAGFGHRYPSGKWFVWPHHVTDLAFLFHCLKDTRPQIAHIVTKSDFATLVEQHIILSKPYSRDSLERTWNNESAQPEGFGKPFGVSSPKKVALRESLQNIADSIA